jgi:hypothetical protein
LEPWQTAPQRHPNYMNDLNTALGTFFMGKNASAVIVTMQSDQKYLAPQPT